MQKVGKGAALRSAVVLSPRLAVESGEYSDLSAMTSLRSFMASLTGHVVAEAARSGGMANFNG